jgi:hypothetical protein
MANKQHQAAFGEEEKNAPRASRAFAGSRFHASSVLPISYVAHYPMNGHQT